MCESLKYETPHWHTGVSPASCCCYEKNHKMSWCNDPNDQLNKKTFLPPDSREFEDLVKILSSFYLDASSRGTFTYCKARLIHNELLEKEFIEKRREMKQEGRTEQELAESYCFLYPDKSKLQWICEKGLSVGHSRITTLGNPATGVYLSKFSDLLQINPFEVGSFGDMIVFKVMRGHLKHIYENMPKNAMEPTPKFDCHVSKSANRVTSLLSYRAFELTQQYFFEFAFDEIKARPRHVRPYAVVSFQYKGKEAASAPMTAHRLVLLPDPTCSSLSPVTKGGMSCSLFEVVDGKGKPTSGSLAALVHKLERDRMVSHSVTLSTIRTPTVAKLDGGKVLKCHIRDILMHEIPQKDPFVPALHYALLKLRPNPGKDLSSGVERQAHDYLTRMESATVRPFILPEYKQNLDERSNLHPAPRPKYNMENLLRTYVHSPTTYILSLTKAKDMIERIQNPVPPPAPAPVEYSPVSDWGGSDRGSDRAERAPERQPQERQPAERAPQERLPSEGSRRRQGVSHSNGAQPQHKSQNYNLTAVMESMGIYDTDLRARGNTHSSSVSETQRLLKILLATLNKAMAQSSMSEQSNHGESSAGSGRREPSIPDPDLRKQEELASQTNYTEVSCVSDKCFLNCLCFPPEKAQPFPEPEAVPDGHAELKSPPPPVVEVKKPAAPPTLTMVEEPPPRPSISLDTILNQEIHSLSSDIKSIMQSHHIYYSSQLPPRLPPRHSWLPNSSFSDFVVPYVTSVPVQGHVKALCEKMSKLIPPPAPKVSPPPPQAATSNLTPPPAITPTPKSKAEPSQSKSGAVSHSRKMGTVKDKASTKTKTEASSTEQGGEIYSPSQVTTDSPESNSTQNPSPNPGSAPAPGSNLLANSLIGQLKPEVFSSLVEIFKDVTKNTVKFYIYSGDEGDERTVCKEIKEYLISLGNSECNPQTFLENSSSLDKLLIIIQNEDIAAHVHKIPALVSLKKLSSVSFAGVDTLDDVKNHTYNELFVSGGFMVSDEFVLNPDLITQDRLQGLLKFLEEQSTPEHPWQWKVHCKSQKKLKELGRLNTNAMGLLNLLTAYQKKHLVEFLPYHECDTQSRQAPDLDCLIKLQAQHTQQRHLIFLTERPFEMFLQYSRNGIVIASIDDIMSGFHSLIGSINQNELPTPPSTGE
uniref:Transcription activation suppressor b n=1 Tax=Myripristis murdjan TaxID=586833 RepID=A0A667ZKQ2_9TELE